MSFTVAFYAPMKAPDHKTPSGDRTIARLLIAALQAAGHRTEVISRFRSWSACPDRQRVLRLHAKQERKRVAAALSCLKPDVWLTYHLSYKAPDWLGPDLSACFGIPYLAAEASDAPAQAPGPWGEGVADVRSALQTARTIFLMKERDRPALERLDKIPAKLVSLPPFVNMAEWPELDRTGRDGPVHLLAAAMMRPGEKLKSYRLLAAGLARVIAPWRLTIAGDGPVQDDVRALFAPFGSRVHFAGAVGGADLQMFYSAADGFIWPGIGEGIGMVYLEAQASGLPVIACRTAGVPDLVRHQKTGLLTAPEPEALAAAVNTMITGPQMRFRMGRAATAHIRARHDMAQARAILDRALQQPEFFA
jgi:glycosyltransferase involved in cell wall biosynthesis